MTLKNALAKNLESKYLVHGEIGTKYDGEYHLIDMLSADVRELSLELNKVDVLCKTGAKIKWICYNKAVGCIEYDIE